MQADGETSRTINNVTAGTRRRGGWWWMRSLSEQPLNWAQCSLVSWAYWKAHYKLLGLHSTLQLAPVPISPFLFPSNKFKQITRSLKYFDTFVILKKMDIITQDSRAIYWVLRSILTIKPYNILFFKAITWLSTYYRSIY